MGAILETTYHILLPLKKCIMNDYNVRGTDKGLDKFRERKGCRKDSVGEKTL